MIEQYAIDIATRKVLGGLVDFFARAIYDVAVDGGAAATYSLSSKVPKNCIITEVLTTEKTALAGGTNISFFAGDTDLTGTIALSGFTGVDIHALAGSVDGIVISADSEMKVVTTGTHTTGKIEIYYRYRLTLP